MSEVNPTFCRCGVMWERPCECPEGMLERFSEYHADKHNSRIFYFDDLQDWARKEFNEAERGSAFINKKIQVILNVEGIIELGMDAYETPYEIVEPLKEIDMRFCMYCYTNRIAEQDFYKYKFGDALRNSRCKQCVKEEENRGISKPRFKGTKGNRTKSWQRVEDLLSGTRIHKMWVSFVAYCKKWKSST